MATISLVIALIIIAGIVLFITVFVVNLVRSARSMAPIEKRPPILTEDRKMQVLTALTRFKTAGPPAGPPPGQKITDAEVMQRVFASASRVACVRGTCRGAGSNQPAYDMYAVVIFNSFNDYYDVGYDIEPQPAEDFGKQIADMLGVPFSLE
jgi:hypothetical protein